MREDESPTLGEFLPRRDIESPAIGDVVGSIVETQGSQFDDASASADFSIGAAKLFSATTKTTDIPKKATNNDASGSVNIDGNVKSLKRHSSVREEIASRRAKSLEKLRARTNSYSTLGQFDDVSVSTEGSSFGAAKLFAVSTTMAVAIPKKKTRGTSPINKSGNQTSSESEIVGDENSEISRRSKSKSLNKLRVSRTNSHGTLDHDDDGSVSSEGSSFSAGKLFAVSTTMASIPKKAKKTTSTNKTRNRKSMKKSSAHDESAKTSRRSKSLNKLRLSRTSSYRSLDKKDDGSVSSEGNSLGAGKSSAVSTTKKATKSTSATRKSDNKKSSKKSIFRNERAQSSRRAKSLDELRGRTKSDRTLDQCEDDGSVSSEGSSFSAGKLFAVSTTMASISKLTKSNTSSSIHISGNKTKSKSLNVGSDVKSQSSRRSTSLDKLLSLGRRGRSTSALGEKRKMRRSRESSTDDDPVGLETNKKKTLSSSKSWQFMRSAVTAVSGGSRSNGGKASKPSMMEPESEGSNKNASWDIRPKTRRSHRTGGLRMDGRVRIVSKRRSRSDPSEDDDNDGFTAGETKRNDSGLRTSSHDGVTDEETMRRTDSGLSTNGKLVRRTLGKDKLLSTRKKKKKMNALGQSSDHSMDSLSSVKEGDASNKKRTRKDKLRTSDYVPKSKQASDDLVTEKEAAESTDDVVFC